MRRSTILNTLTLDPGLVRPALGFDDGDQGGGSAGGGDGDTGGGSNNDDGGSGDGDGGEGSGDGSGEGSDADDGDKGGKPSGDGDGGQGGAPKTYDEKYVKQLRDENAKARRAAKDAAEQAAQKARDEIAQGIGKVLGLVKDEDDTPPDPAELTKQLATQTTEARAAKVELAVYRAAPRDVDADALLDSRSFAAKLGKLDPTADDFEDQVSTAISEHVEKHPKFKVGGQGPATKTGGDFTGGTGDDAPPSDQLSVDEQRKARQARRAATFKPS